MLNILLRRTLVFLARIAADWRYRGSIRIGVAVPQGHDEELCYDRIFYGLDLIERLVPYRYERMQRDVREIICLGTGRNAALGAYVPLFRACLIDPRHLLDSAVGPLDVAKTILHEATHARLHASGSVRAQHGGSRAEAICLRAERDLERKYAVTAP